MYDRSKVFAAACLGMLLFGIVMTTLGAILPDLMLRFGVDKAAAGSLFLLMSFGVLLGSVVFGPLVDRYGYKGQLVLCAAMILLGLEGTAFANTFGLLYASVFLFGFGGGIINGGTNALVADISEGGRSANLSLLGVFFGLGAFGMPFTLGFLLKSFSYSAILAGVGLVALLPLVFFAAIRFPAPKLPQGFPLASSLKLVGDRTLLLLGLILFLQSGMEILVGGWTAAYFNEVLALDASDAVFFLSLFTAGMTVARLLLGGILRKRAPAPVFKASIALALAGAVLLLVAGSAAMAAPGVFLIGAGLGAGFPVVLGFVGDRYPALSGTAFSIVLVVALIGGSVLPYLAGVFGSLWSLQASFLIVPVALLLQIALLIFVLPRLKTAASASVGVA